MPGRAVPWLSANVVHRRSARLCVYLLLSLAVIVGLYAKSHQEAAQVADSTRTGCVRGNVLRTVVGKFLLDAAKARSTPPVTERDREAARAYRQLARQLEEAAVYGTDVPARVGNFTVPCARAFPRP